MKKRILSIALVSSLILANNGGIFAKAWYDDAVEFSKDRGIIEKDIDINNSVTKYQALKSIYLLDNNDPTRDNVSKWALEKNIIATGEDLEKSINRGEISNMVLAYIKSLDINTLAGKDLESVKDYEKIQEAYLESLSFAYENKIIVGDNLGYINASKNLREVELLKILQNLSEFLNKELPGSEKQTVTGKIAEIEKYGHGSLDITIDDFMNKYGFEFGDTFDVVASNGFKLENIPFLDNYYVDRGEYMIRAYEGHKNIAICINYGKFNELSKLEVGDELTISLNTKAGALALYEMNQLDRTNNRSDYSSDESFANFREIQMGKLGRGALYRSSSPINNEINRASYADKFLEANKVNAVLNLADTDEEIKNHLAKEDFNSPYYKSLLDKGHVKVNGLSVNYAGEDFGKKLTEGLKFFTSIEGPYHVHCNEGKDRAGFASALLASLMGGGVDEIIDDYMKSYENYYHLEKGEKYDIIVNENIKDMLRIIAGVDKSNDLTNVDLVAGAKKYLIKNGMTESELSSLIENLSKDYREAEKTVSGKVIEVSKYGNITVDVSLNRFKALGFEPGDILRVRVNDTSLMVPFGDAYSNVDNKKEVIVPNKDGNSVIVAINMGDFSKTYGADLATELEFSMGEKAGYKEEYEIRSIDKYRTNKREDYSSDEVFANFRPIVMGNIKPGVLYRTSSPINPELGRSKYANDLIEKVGVKTVINMADSKEELESYFNLDSFESPYYKDLYEKGQVKYLDMGVDFTSPDFHKKLKAGLEFMAENTGPFAVHCNEGKDRAGFISIVLEALMGGSVDEIKEDYMLSYINYYFVEKDSTRYEKIADSNVMKSLKMIAGVETEKELREVDLAHKTEVYLKEVIKLDDLTIKKLKNVLARDLEVKLGLAS